MLRWFNAQDGDRRTQLIAGVLEGKRPALAQALMNTPSEIIPMTDITYQQIKAAAVPEENQEKVASLQEKHDAAQTAQNALNVSRRAVHQMLRRVSPELTSVQREAKSEELESEVEETE